MSIWSEAFEKVGVTAAQVLLTEDDFTSRGRYLALRATLEELLSLGVVPVLNENDTVGTAELEAPAGHVFGDNDKLSALVASKVGADLLVILSDVDGLHTANPARNRAARRIPVVAEVNAEVRALAEGAGAARTGRDGDEARGRRHRHRLRRPRGRRERPQVPAFSRRSSPGATPGRSSSRSAP